MEEPAVALKEGEVVAPLATVTEAGTVRRGLLLAKVIVAPPVGAALLKVTVQLEAAFVFRLPGLHVTDETVGTVMVPLVPETVSWEPAALTPTKFDKVIGDVTGLDPSVSETLATTPEAIVVSDPVVAVPTSTQVTDPAVGELQVSVLLAAVAAAPALGRPFSVYWPEG
jgi:hypothetical protein